MSSLIWFGQRKLSVYSLHVIFMSFLLKSQRLCITIRNLRISWVLKLFMFVVLLFIRLKQLIKVFISRTRLQIQLRILILKIYHIVFSLRSLVKNRSVLRFDIWQNLLWTYFSFFDQILLIKVSQTCLIVLSWLL